MSHTAAQTIHITRKADKARLRRYAMGAQGLLQAQPFGRGLSGARKAINHIGYVQIDTISVVERAHHHVLRSRVPNYHPDMTNRLLLDRSVFEYWSHAAALLPMADFRFSLPYKEGIKGGKTHWQRNPDRKLMKELLRRIETEGALRSRDVEEGTGNSAGWWDWKPAKRALEQLFMEGDLMITSREGFQKTYDLPERVLPDWVDTSTPTYTEFAAHLLEQQLRCHGFVSLKGITYYRRNAELRSAVRQLVDEKLANGELDLIKLDSGEQFFCSTGMFDTPAPRAAHRVSILSPFDNSVIQRERLNALFTFDYQIECYVTEAKRRYGYFCLPLLYRDHFVGRMDCKAHRKQRHLEIKALHFEQHSFAEEDLLDAMAHSIEDFAGFQDCDTTGVTKVDPAHLAEPLRLKLQHLSPQLANLSA